jgi:hypothetical protein
MTCTGCGLRGIKRTHRSGTSTTYKCQMCATVVQVARTGSRPQRSDRP